MSEGASGPEQGDVVRSNGEIVGVVVSIMKFIWGTFFRLSTGGTYKRNDDGTYTLVDTDRG